MLRPIKNYLSQVFNKTRTINNEPLNKVSLVVIIIVDIFILTQVFTGLNDISQWYMSPYQAYPCYSDWKFHLTRANNDFSIIRASVDPGQVNDLGFQKMYQSAQNNHLGQVSSTCLDFGGYRDKINNSENQRTARTIDNKQSNITNLEKTNSKIQSQYNSTLLEKIAGQPREKSINVIDAERAKQELDQNKTKIAVLKREITDLKTALMAKPESASFLEFLRDAKKFKDVEARYQHASFWYPSIQILFQALFLIPLILLALWVHTITQRKGYGLAALMSWHLLIIFLIPLVIKIFEFLQIGLIFESIFRLIQELFGGLLFLVSYAYIVLIPLLGFGIIQLFQNVIFSTRGQIAKRVQKSTCIHCAKRIKAQDAHCPHCGYYQYIECQNCHELTYKGLPYCKQCGTSQDLSPFNK
jgi:peptidoglycan hydrolase CwlO-like protein